MHRVTGVVGSGAGDDADAGGTFADRELDQPELLGIAQRRGLAGRAAADGEGFALQAAEDEAEADAERAESPAEGESTEEATAVAVMEDEGPEPARIQI